MDSFVKSKNPNAPQIASHFIELGKELGIRGDIAFCQSIKETGWFKFGGDVTPDQNNFCGLGTIGGGVKGAQFSTPREGVLAQLQHLWAYATKNPFPSTEKIVDPRFNLVSKGTAPNWEDLAGKWAVPGYNKTAYPSLEAAFKDGKTYGQEILAIFEDAKKFTPPSNPEPPKQEDNIVQKTANESVFYTASQVNGANLSSVVINGKGYISATDVAKLIGQKALYDKLKNIIVFIKE